MAWYDLPDAIAYADRPLCSALTRQLQADYEQVHAMSFNDRPAMSAAGEYWEFSQTDDTWLQVDTWIPMPIRLRPLPDGTWRPLRISVLMTSVVSDITVRAYLLDRSHEYTEPMLDDTDCLPGVPSYDEQSTTAGSWTTEVFDVQPSLVGWSAPRAPGVALPWAWLHFFSTCAATPRTLQFYAPRYRELEEIV